MVKVSLHLGVDLLCGFNLAYMFYVSLLLKEELDPLSLSYLSILQPKVKRSEKVLKITHSCFICDATKMLLSYICCDSTLNLRILNSVYRTSNWKLFCDLLVMSIGKLSEKYCKLHPRIVGGFIFSNQESTANMEQPYTRGHLLKSDLILYLKYKLKP